MRFYPVHAAPSPQPPYALSPNPVRAEPVEAPALTLEVADNGAGFDPTAAFPGHLGLRSMRERAESAGGRLQITSEPGAGTRVIATFAVS